MERKITISVETTFGLFSNIEFFKQRCYRHNVDIINIEFIKGRIFQKYRIELHGKKSDINKVLRGI